MNRERVFAELSSTLQRLAAPGEIALARLPKNCHRPDELALEYEQSLRVAIANYESELPEASKVALCRVDAELESMSGSQQNELWTEEAVCHNPKWAEIRLLARAALDAMNWKPDYDDC